MSHEWFQVSLKIDRAPAVTMSRRGARGHITKRKDKTIHTTTWTTHHQTPQRSTIQHSRSWRSATDAILLGHREHTRWVPAGHPRYTRADYDQEAVGGSISRARDTSHRHTSCEQGWRPNSLVAEYMVAKPSRELRQPTRVQITLTWQRTRNKLNAKYFACRSKTMIKTAKKRTCRLFAKNSSYREENLD